MAFDPTPWAIGGGASHGPDVLRLLAYAGTGGAEGVIAPGDLKVTALATPGGSVQIAAGAALILNRSAAGASQSYAARNPTVDTVAVSAQGSGGGRSDLVVVRVEDPQYSPWTAPADPLTYQYVRPFVVQNVPAGTTTAAALNLGYSAVALARIDLPTSTSSVTNAMIVDLRKMALPRSQREVEVGLPGSSRPVPGPPTYINNQWYEISPIANLKIPVWANTAVVSVTVSGLEQVTGAFLGDMRAHFFGGQAVTSTVLDLNWSGSPARYSYMVAGRIPVLSQYRGTIGTGALEARRRGGTGSVETDTGSTIFTDITFQETAS